MQLCYSKIKLTQKRTKKAKIIDVKMWILNLIRDQGKTGQKSENIMQNYALAMQLCYIKIKLTQKRTKKAKITDVKLWILI